MKYQLLPKECNVEDWPEMRLVGATLKENRRAYLKVSSSAGESDETVESIQVSLQIQTRPPLPMGYMVAGLASASDLERASGVLSRAMLPASWIMSNTRLEHRDFVFANIIAELCGHEVHVDWKAGENPKFSLRLQAGGHTCYFEAGFNFNVADRYLEEPS